MKEIEKKSADTLNSTYWWTIKLDPSHEENSPKGHTLYGYSKLKGYDEMRDKIDLLFKEVIMFQKQGYYDKIIQIEFYKKNTTLLDKNNSTLLFILFKDDFALNKAIYQDQAKRKEVYGNTGIIHFLDQFYLLKRQGKELDQLRRKKDPNFSKDDYLDPSKWEFATRSQLYAHCQRLIDNGHPYGAVSHFQRQYEEKHFPDDL